MKNIFTIIFLIFFSLSLVQISKADKIIKNTPSKNTPLKFDKKFSGKIKVLDGDSIFVNKKEVRLYGLDAPEYSQTCFDKENQEYACGKNSRQFLYNLAHNKEGYCFYAKKDIYNRYLGKCFIENTSINQAILKNGMAVIYSFKNIERSFEILEKEARKKELGIWQGKFELPKDYRKRNKKYGKRKYSKSSAHRKAKN